MEMISKIIVEDIGIETFYYWTFMTDKQKVMNCYYFF